MSWAYLDVRSRGAGQTEALLRSLFLSITREGAEALRFTKPSGVAGEAAESKTRLQV